MAATTGRAPADRTIRLAIRRGLAEHAGRVAEKVAARALAGDADAQRLYADLLRLILDQPSPKTEH
ncbi:protein of unknown function [Thauera humireducens]|uniref:hypothetical protein n=1 Tax=Thauera humireducens TaxID=1134435 RepID=UPI002467A317|nr:hypothetical protein [Thauera humireducens]CAH1747489.1 protein of unknown function [Thauera humireducens]